MQPASDKQAAPAVAQVPMNYDQMRDFIETHADYNIAGWRVLGMDKLMDFIGKVERAHGIAAAPNAPAQEPRNVRERWNIELDGNDLLVCFNDHDKGDKCRYQRYVPAQAAQSAGEVERNAQKLRARFDELLNRYWSLGHAEGKEGSNHDTEGGDAQITLCELHDLFRAALSHKEQECTCLSTGPDYCLRHAS